MPRRSEPTEMSLKVGNRIRQLRHERGMSMQALADAAAFSKGHLSTVEAGLCEITVGTIAKIAQGLNVSPMYLLTGDSEREQVAELLRSVPEVEVKKLRRQLQSQLRK